MFTINFTFINLHNIYYPDGKLIKLKIKCIKHVIMLILMNEHLHAIDFNA